MSDIKLFKLVGTGVTSLPSSSVALEKSLQTLMEQNLEALMGIRFLETEYWTGLKHNGRIDTLGVDENGCPVIIEYKRSMNQNVMNQGLYYLDWLLDHKAEFKLLVMEKLGKDVADKLHWEGVRLICVAGDYTKYDQHAVQQISASIELVRYARYGDELLLLELINTRPATKAEGKAAATTEAKAAKAQKLDDLHEALRAFLVNLADDVSENQLKLYVAYRRIKNFACVCRTKTELVIWLKVDPSTIALEANFSRDVRTIGHWGTGDLELTLRTLDDLEKAKPLILKSYEAS
jgi:predicted transport protein